MSRLIKTLMLALAGIVLLVVLSAAALLVFFDPNDFREDIAAQVEKATGRELVIEGDLAVSLFPWLAVEVGRARLGNADGFGDTPFASFESARLSVRLLPLLLRQDIAVGTAALESLQLDLAVNASGVSNWDDLSRVDDAAAADVDADDGGPTGLDIASVEINGATIRYRDAAAGSDYRLSDVSLTTGRIAIGEAFRVRSSLRFEATPGELSGTVSLEGSVNLGENFDAVSLADLAINGNVAGVAAQPTDFRLAARRLVADLAGARLEPTSLDLEALGLAVSADVQSLSWADAVTAEARLQVGEFSLVDLMTLLDAAPPATADPAALRRVGFSASAVLDSDTLSLQQLELRLDDTRLTGELAYPLSGNAPIRFDLGADRINLDRYMAPAAETASGAAASGTDDFEIPVELIRSVNARGSLRVDEATLSGMTFSGVQLGLNSGNGKLRLNPQQAGLFDGDYSGDVQIDASGNVPTMSMNERVSDVSLTPLAQAMFERDNISGTINGSFVLNTRGRTLANMRENLNGNMSFELADGAWQGVDLWYQLRAARAIYRRETAPEPRTPARTEFSSVLATGTVTNGVFANDDLVAEMPFLRVTGNGTVNLVAGEIDYALQARVLERPEFLRGASDAELQEFTEALIPVRVRGPLTDPSIRPDIEAMFRKEVEDTLKEKGDELRRRLLDRLAPPKPDQDTGAADGAAADGAAGEVPEEPDAEDQLKDRLKKLFGQ